MVACAPAPEPEEDLSTLDHFGYALSTPLRTTNAASLVGASTSAQLLSVRIFPSVYVAGPSGQMIPNTDLVSTQVLPGANRQVIYTLSEDTVWSDGTPITCTDYLLNYKAGVMSTLFESYLPLTEQIERMSCEPGAKRFTVVFKEDAGARWRQLFSPGTVLPAHAIAEKAGLSTAALHDALQAEDRDQLEEVARIWREDFNLDSFDPALQLSSGPYRVESVGESGEVTLVANERYFGDQPVLSRLVVWPGEVDKAALAAEGAIQIADADNYDWVNRDDPMNQLRVEDLEGILTESLVLGSSGVFYGQPSRQAFTACVDQRAVAAASSAVAGRELPVVGTHVVSHFDPVARQLAGVVEPKLGVDTEQASALWGTTVRIGYQGPDERMAAMVESIRVSCEAAGITVVDASAEGSTMADLARLGTGPWGEELYLEGSLDAVLRPVDPLVEYGGVIAEDGNVAALWEAEEQAWEEARIIPLAAQPRTFAIDGDVGNVVEYTGSTGIGWNMDRWRYEAPITEEEEE
ncbi:Bacterial extracellular solute-binding protein, family 5 [Corynebacterium occultum]|uniref:Bacterial extracellular solute-binding protein, family 5 n=1 Tax=Corynebacterium occultum TaxID=2675219 RepID=A0A6B8W8E3_9CORY|nr:ABC transporter substrate-binding protein [Corynebacterium occultum]QGU07545.1 Bacterial extracellular solute-binding protein, family 5 [Corynebacterium occultum]